MNDLRAKVRRVAELLVRMYGHKYLELEDPLEALILTVLSQNTSDVNSHRAYRNLRERFPTWEAVMEAPLDEVAGAIRSGGLAREKAGYIQRILGDIKASRGSLDLGFLRALGPADALKYLRSFRGVGPKTAACTLLFGCGFPVFPVDTHILRIAKRLAFLPDGAGLAEAHEVMGEIVPADITYEFHVNMIEHGRKLCRPHNPLCEECLLQGECLYLWNMKRP